MKPFRTILLLLIAFAGVLSTDAQIFRKKKKQKHVLASEQSGEIITEGKRPMPIRIRKSLKSRNSIDYLALDRQIDSLISIRQYKTAAVLNAELGRIALTDARKGYWVKSVLYECTLMGHAEESDAGARQWSRLRNAYDSADEAGSMLMAMELADFLRSRFNAKRRFAESTDNDSAADPLQWSKERLHAEANRYISLALDLAADYTIADPAYVEPLISHAKAYDWFIDLDEVFALRAIEILNGLETETDILYRSPAADFAMSESDSFLKQNYNTQKDPKNEYRILSLYQLLLKNYKVYFDLQRLAYVNSHFNRKDDFLKALERLYAGKRADPFVNFVAIDLSELYVTQKDEPAKALALIEDALRNHPDFRGNFVLQVRQKNIKLPGLSLNAENVNKPGQAMLASVSYKNTDKCYIRVYRIGDDTSYVKVKAFVYTYTNDRKKVVLNRLASLQEMPAQQVIDLPGFGDYRMHTAEIALKSLQAGTYLIVSSTSPVLMDTASVLHVNVLTVSPFVLLKEENILSLHNAEDGKFAADVPYRLLQSKGGVYQQIRTGKTDAEGRIVIPGNAPYYNTWMLDIGNATLFYEAGYYAYEPGKQKDQMEVKVLTDRSIYRPGQTVYFKCIAYMATGKKTVKGKKLKVVLYNSNGEDKGSLNLITNSYGSVSGSFILPKTGFNTGVFNLSVEEYGQQSFMVEEYKRPKYNASILAPDSAFKLFDSVTLKGKATALAGYAIQQAKVTYTVVRKERALWWSWRFPPGASNTQTIRTAETTTDRDGLFEIHFRAIPDPLKSESDNPYFVYTVNATVVDVNGETRTCSYDMTMAYTDRELMLKGSASYMKQQTAELNFSVQNLQGKTMPFTGKIVLKRITENEGLKRERYWTEPDTSVIGRSDYLRDFKSYSSLNTIETYIPLTEKQFTGDVSGKWIIPSGDLLIAGNYVAVMQATDGRGKPLEAEFRFTVNDVEPGPYHLAKALQVHTINGNAFEPGSTARLLLSSAAENAMVSFIASSERGIIMRKTIQLNRNSVAIDLPVTAADRGNISVQVGMVYDYRFYSVDETILVPYSNKQLAVKLSSFRSDMEPGSREKWTITLKGPASEKAAVEMAAVMYDKSLDALYADNGWQFWVYRDFYQNRTTEHNLEQASSFEWLGVPTSSASYKTYIYPAYNEADLSSFRGFMMNYSDMYAFGTKFDRFYANTALERGARKDGNVAKLLEGKLSADVSESSEGLSFSVPDSKETTDTKAEPTVPVLRKDFKETAFFFPQLYANKKGEIQIEFTMPEALTQWRMQMLAHSTSMQLGYAEQLVSTSKKLMVQPNMPRFLRQGDRIQISSKLINTGTESLKVIAGIEIIDEGSGKPLNWLTEAADKTVMLAAGGIGTCNFSLQIPEFTGVVSIRITANAGQYSDGEQHTLLVLSRRSLITRTMPLTIRKAGIQSFEFTALKNNNSQTLKHEKLSVEMSSNPAWYAIQSLPYLMEHPNECAEQIFTRLYANSIAMTLANRDPAIKQVYQSWQRASALPGSLQSKLMQNQDLKASLIEETPWLNTAKNETERMQKLGKLFETEKMKDELSETFDRLKDMQTYEGGWPWFKGMQANLYITQTIVTGFGKMQKTGVDIRAYMPMIEKAIAYLDKQCEEDYRRMKNIENMPDIVNYHLQYLYCKRFFPETGFKPDHEMLQFFIKQAELHWSSNTLLNQAQLALALLTLKPDSKIPELIIRGFNESAKQSDEMGMYWPENQGGYYWYQAPVETQAAIIELYAAAGKNPDQIREQQIWLLRQKQTQSWRSSRSTADACYALLSTGNLLNSKQKIMVSVGGQQLIPAKTEPGSGYFRQDIPAATINQSSAGIGVTASTDGFAYGAVYWQYFENNDQVESAGAGLQIEKKLYKIIQTAEGTRKAEIKPGDTIDIGDQIEVVLFLSCDRNLEFVHVKDNRAAGTEASSVLSSYQWKNGLSYYMSTRDASSSFFIDQLAKGTYQLSYILKAEQAGSFDCGFAIAQCMYAPEYAANSSSVRIIIR